MLILCLNNYSLETIIIVRRFRTHGIFSVLFSTKKDEWAQLLQIIALVIMNCKDNCQNPSTGKPTFINSVYYKVAESSSVIEESCSNSKFFAVKYLHDVFGSFLTWPIKNIFYSYCQAKRLLQMKKNDVTCCIILDNKFVCFISTLYLSIVVKAQLIESHTNK